MSRFLGCVLFRRFIWSKADSNRDEQRSPAIGTVVNGGRPPGPSPEAAGRLSNRLTSKRGRNRDSENKQGKQKVLILEFIFIFASIKW